MTDEPVVNLYPDDPDMPTLWISDDDGSPTVVLRKASDGIWTALFDRSEVARAPTAEALTAYLLSDHGLVAVLADHGLTADA
jgi:hypothetical protein